jgi:hypothetical protein
MSLTLDPFSTLARLALLSFMEDGVKIGIRQHAIVVFKDTFMDRALRTFFSFRNTGCSRESLYTLRYPLLLARRWYDVPLLFDLACDGLLKLQRTYQLSSGNVVDTITFAIHTLASPTSDEEPLTSTEHALRRCWKTAEIKALLNWFELLKNPDLQKEHVFIMTSIDDYLKGKEHEVRLILTL